MNVVGCTCAAVLLMAFAQTHPPLGEELLMELPVHDGTIGGVVVRRNNSEQVLDKAFAGSRIGSQGTQEAMSLSAEAVNKIFSDTVAALPGRPATFLLYFLEGKDELTTASNAELANVLDEIKRRPAPDLLVTGHADNVGSDVVNDKLSLARAERMRELLTMRGINVDRIQVAGRGKRELLIVTREGVAEERNRRVEINVR